MSTVGQKEKATQQRVVTLFQQALGYAYLGNWIERTNNRPIEPELLRAYLQQQGVADVLISRAIFQLEKVAGDVVLGLYDRNRAVYELLRYGVKVKPDVGEQTQDVWLIDWKHPERNHFAIAEEVTVKGKDSKASTKRPDVVLYVNGIALGVLELKRSTVGVVEGIRQNLDNQRPEFIEPFFATMQFVMAGNDTEGMRYGTIATPEKHYPTWKDEGVAADAHDTLLDRHLVQLCGKARLLELIHDFIVYDAGIKKLCRHNQYFGVRAAQEHLRRREGGIIWHTQGSGKSLTMVWLAKWIRENRPDARVLIITDRTELDEQIEKVFYGVNEAIYRTSSGADLIAKLNDTSPWLMCSLIHKFGGKEDGEEVGDIAGYVAAVQRSLPPDFQAKGDLVVFVDECHRTQSGDLHKAMKAIVPNAIFIGFTGTPLLKEDKKRSIEVFGRYIHTYKFDEAVADGVVLDLRYEARDIDQRITSQGKIDQWFDAHTKSLTDLARAQLKAKWGTMQTVLSSQSRLAKIVNDILLDMATRDRLLSGRGNAMLVAGSIYEACKYYELFAKTTLAGHCAVVSSYVPSVADIKGETTGEGTTDKLQKYAIYRQMLADWFKEPADEAVKKVDKFESQVKSKFIKEPAQMKLLIVVDKLLTGFDAPSATYLYIDKQMRDHGLFQAICRVNRLDGDDKDVGYIVDYKDLFKRVEGAIHDYTAGALDGYDAADVAGLLEDRLGKATEKLEETREAIKALCEPVGAPRDTQAYLRYFCAKHSGDAAELKDNEPKRLALYKMTAAFVRAYANLADELDEAGYSAAEIAALKDEVGHFEGARSEVKIASGDYIDLKAYEPAMRHLIDTYIQAEDSEVVSAFDDLSLVQMIVKRGAAAVDALPAGLKQNKETVAETIENNVRKLIIDESPINPKYYEKMSALLEALIEQRRQNALDYADYLAQMVELAKQAVQPGGSGDYPAALNTSGKRALFDNLGRDLALALAVDHAVVTHAEDGWRDHRIKTRKVMFAIKAALQGVQVLTAAEGQQAEPMDDLVDRILTLVKNQADY
jgi:type I restriction enzyme R subunit